MADKKFVSNDNLLYIWSKIKALLSGKVDKVEGKGLSTNDLTDELKKKILDAGSSSFTGVYNDLLTKPKINGKDLVGGNNTLTDLGIQAAGDYATNTSLTSGLNGKVDKVAGKTLSTNDYTTAEKNKLTGIATGAQVNVIETIKKNGAALKVTDKGVDILVPTKLSELNNDGSFVADDSYVHTDNNYTTVEKNKLASVAENAQVNIIESISVNGKVATITDKGVDITVPTKVSSLSNDSKYQTDKQVSSAITTATKDLVSNSDMTTAITTATNGLASQTWVNTQLANINKKEVVTSLESMTNVNTIYLMANSGETNNIYDEYILVNGTPEKIGTTEVDLTNYLQKSDLVELTNDEIDTIFATE